MNDRDWSHMLRRISCSSDEAAVFMASRSQHPLVPAPPGVGSRDPETKQQWANLWWHIMKRKLHESEAMVEEVSGQADNTQVVEV